MMMITENDIVYCVLILQGILRVSSDLDTDRGVLTQGGYVRGGLFRQSFYRRGVSLSLHVDGPRANTLIFRDEYI